MMCAIGVSRTGAPRLPTRSPTAVRTCSEEVGIEMSRVEGMGGVEGSGRTERGGEGICVRRVRSVRHTPELRSCPQDLTLRFSTYHVERRM